MPTISTPTPTRMQRITPRTMLSIRYATKRSQKPAYGCGATMGCNGAAYVTGAAPAGYASATMGAPLPVTAGIGMLGAAAAGAGWPQFGQKPAPGFICAP